MKKQLLLCAIVWMLGPAQFCEAQIRVSTTNIDNWIKNNFSGQGVIIGNIKHHGNPVSQATFTSSAGILQIPKGLILSSGSAFNISGFNGSHDITTALGSANEAEQDPQLSPLLKEALFDISYIEFDFVPMDNSVQFSYQFGSDEYPEYVGSAYNDIFAFFISDSSSSKNIALVPGKDIPVSINNVNTKSGAEYFIDNNPFSQVTIKRTPPPSEEKVERSFFGGIWHAIKKFFTGADEEEKDRVMVLPDQELVKKLNGNLYRNLQYDGITKKLVAQAYVTPYKKYHLKIIIADVSDNIYDSGVFIEDRSLTAKKDPGQPGFVDYPDLKGKIDPKAILAGTPVDMKLLATPASENVPSAPTQSSTVTSNPQKSVPAPVGKPGTARLGQPADVTIYFEFDKSTLTESEMEKIKQAADTYKKVRQQYALRITGHTDSIGSLNYNYALSKRRDLAVVKALKDLVGGINPVLTERAYLDPAADNGTDSGRQANRRVTISFKKKK